MKISVRQGDSIWYYSQLFRVSFHLIVDSNPGVNPNALAIGQIITIPGFVVREYRVKSGDTLWQIAQNQGVSPDAIAMLNQGINPNSLRVSQMLFLPIRVNWMVVNGKREYDYQAMTIDLQRLVEIYPFLRRRSIGNSVMQKSIPEVQVGKGNKKVHLNASFHAHEWITTPILMTLLNDYLLALTNRGSIRENQIEPYYHGATMSIVPMVNPDGVNLVLNGLPAEEPFRSRVLAINEGVTNFSNWKANINGVDLNNQFPARWELEAARKPNQPAPRDYPGTAPLTEPESIAIANLTRNSNFNRVLALHTQGEVIYWGFLNLEPPEAARLAEEFARVSGYQAVKIVDSYAGYKDWFIQEWRRPGFTLELGSGVNPLPLDQFDEIYQEMLGIFLANLYM